MEERFSSGGFFCKRKLVYHRHDATRDEATQDIFECIEVFYNRPRRHSTLGYKSPM
jgi:transposase InsO family protein